MAYDTHLSKYDIPTKSWVKSLVNVDDRAPYDEETEQKIIVGIFQHKAVYKHSSDQEEYKYGRTATITENQEEPSDCIVIVRSDG